MGLPGKIKNVMTDQGVKIFCKSITSHQIRVPPLFHSKTSGDDGSIYIIQNVILEDFEIETSPPVSLCKPFHIMFNIIFVAYFQAD